MLLFLSDWLLSNHYEHLAQLLQYTSVRAIIALVLSLSISLAVGSPLIRFLQKLSFGQVVRNDGPESHFSKRGTPTMGGIMIVGVITLGMLLCCRLTEPCVWIVLFTLLSHAAIGFADDYLKVVRKNPDGLIARWKYFWQSVCAIIIGCSIYYFYPATPSSPDNLNLVFPFFKNFQPSLGIFFIVFVYFVIVGSSNAVNLTDGLDGLAGSTVMMVAIGLGVVAWLTSNSTFATYLYIPYLPHAIEMGVVCALIVGACIGFIWFNGYPAQLFMGDVGSLSLGALLGVIAVVVREEFLLFIMGGIFVIETISVILQVGSYKLRKKRIFKMAPIHHHFEKSGWPETRVVVRFAIITLILVLFGLLTLKLR